MEKVICPFRHIGVTYTKQFKYEYNTEGQQIGCTECYVEKITPMECPKEGCGAWNKNGFCGYNIDTIEEVILDGSEGVTGVPE